MVAEVDDLDPCCTVQTESPAKKDENMEDVEAELALFVGSRRKQPGRIHCEACVDHRMDTQSFQTTGYSMDTEDRAKDMNILSLWYSVPETVC